MVQALYIIAGAVTVTIVTWVKVQNFQNPELSKLQLLNMQYGICPLNIHNLRFKWWNVLTWDRVKINQRSPNSAFWGWLSTESQPQNPEFRNNPENFHLQNVLKFQTNMLANNKVLDQILFCLFDLISLCPSQQSFSYIGRGLPGLNQY